MNETSKNQEVLDVLYKKGEGCEIVAIIGDMAIYRNTKKAYKKHPYGCCLKKEDNWNDCHFITDTIDSAILAALGYKHVGDGGSFLFFARRMLGF